MSDGYTTLIRLFCKSINKVEGFRDRNCLKVTPARFKHYLSRSLSERRKIHERLRELEVKTEGVSLTFKPTAFGEDSELESIDIKNTRAFLTACKELVLFDQVNEACEQLQSSSPCLPTWAEKRLEKITECWSVGKRGLGCMPKDYDRLVDAFKFVEWRESYGPQNSSSMDMRTVSTALYGTSKRLQSISSLISRIYNPILPELVQEASTDEVLAHLGVCKFPPLFKFKGGISVQTQAGIIMAGNVYPFLGLPPDGVENLIIESQPDYVLFIENETTFNRYTREINDNGLIFYTNGFPSRQWQHLFKELVLTAGESVQFYHWGDADIGGYRILCFMQQLLNVDLKPYLMAPSEETPKTALNFEKQIPIKGLIRVLEHTKSEGINHLRQILLSATKTQATIPWVEQEHLPVVCPMKLN